MAESVLKQTKKQTQQPAQSEAQAGQKFMWQWEKDLHNIYICVEIMTFLLLLGIAIATIMCIATFTKAI